FTLVQFHSNARQSRTDRATLATMTHSIAADAGIARVNGVEFSRDGHAAVITATPSVIGESNAAKALVARLRAQLPAITGGRARVQVGGTTAQEHDLASLVSGSMWKIALFVLLISYLVLLVLLRSVVLPLKAVVMNLLSVGAGFGALVAVF